MSARKLRHEVPCYDAFTIVSGLDLNMPWSGRRDKAKLRYGRWASLETYLRL